ncbi:MAG: hypothetical protein M1816_002074 [Peltula sp. TS41687]|nr:MAG: hypothetical protein M1816_002074 [Peltula sp. TS41687]
MPRILVLGATGFLGTSICRLLRLENNIVYGLARNAAKAASLSAAEILPVIGDIEQHPDAYLDLIRDAHIDVVIDASGANAGAFKLLEDLRRVGKERLQSGGQRLGFLYTSGGWVHGSSWEQVGDLDPVGEGVKTKPVRMVEWRPQLEKDILAAKDELDVVVLRPSMMYGGTSSIWALLFGSVLGAARAGGETGKVQVQADEGCVTSLAHVDDVALAYVRAVEKVHVLAGTGVVPVFDLMTSWENIGVIVGEFARCVGLKGELEFVGTKGDVFAEALSTTLKSDSSRARQILGWTPKKTEGLAAGMEIYAPAFAVGQGSGAEK